MQTFRHIGEAQAAAMNTSAAHAYDMAEQHAERERAAGNPGAPAPGEAWGFYTSRAARTAGYRSIAEED